MDSTTVAAKHIHENRHSTFQPHHAPHGRDGGFLTYFFGNPGVSPEPRNQSNSRSASPLRASDKEDGMDYASNRSVDEVSFSIDVIRLQI